MRPQKKAKEAPTSNGRLADDFMLHTEMCQSAIKELKQLMRRSKFQEEALSSNAKSKQAPAASSKRTDREPPPSVNQKGSSHQSNPSLRMQNGLHSQSEVPKTEPSSLLEKLRRIGEEVDEFLRTSESCMDRHHKRTRRLSSCMEEHQDSDHFCREHGNLNVQAESSNGFQSFTGQGEKLDEGFVDLKACTSSEGLDDIQEDAKNDKPVEVHTEHDGSTIDQTLEGDDEKEETESEDDGLEELWRDAEFSRECLVQDQRVEQSELSADKGVCKHKFFLKSDVGLVCDACGLVGKDIETIFNFTWGSEPKRRENTKAGVYEAATVAEFRERQDGILEQTADIKKMHQSLILHSHYRAEMHEHQIEGFKFLKENIVNGELGGCILAHAPGTGKTFLTIAFLHSFLQAYPDKRVMVLAPKGMLLPWATEFRKWKVDLRLLNLFESSYSSQLTMDLSDYGIEMTDNNARGQLIKLNQLQKVREWQMRKSILLVSYPHFSSLVNHQSGDAVTMEVRRLLLEVPGLLILDEGHISRNSDTIILKSLTGICTRKRIMLSGTLFQNNFEEMYNLCKLVRPTFMRERAESIKGFLKNLFDEEGTNCMHSKFFDVKSSEKKHPEEVTEQRIFVNCLCESIETGKVEEQNEALKLLRELMAPFVHWHKGKALEGLPGLTDFTIFLKLTSAQEAAFATIKREALNIMKREKRSALVNVHPLLLKMRPPKQASQSKEESELNEENKDQDAAQNGNSLSMMAKCDPTQGCKAMFVLDVVALCSQLQEKVLVFSQYLSPLTLLQKLFWRLWGWNDNQQVFRLDGEISSENRERIINRFNKDKDSRVLLASVRACGEGVSLVGASRVVFLDMNWNPAVTQQAISRAFRLGQMKRVYAYRLVGIGTLDEEIERTASRKEWLAAMITRASSKSQLELCSEVDPQMEDELFESAELRRQVARCFRKTENTIAL